MAEPVCVLAAIDAIRSDMKCAIDKHGVNVIVRIGGRVRIILADQPSNKVGAGYITG